MATNIDSIGRIEADMCKWRQDIHAHPETAFEEFRTAGIVADLLSSWGIQVHRGIAVTGVVGILHGAGGPGGRRIGLRADMDALNMEERKTVPWRSRHAGKMHGCGHDGHTSMLLGAAQYLAQTRNFAGTICFIFQPGEESAGGARRMIEEGLFERFPVETVWAVHNWPRFPVGKIAVHKTAVMAASDYFQIIVRGKGAHGGLPHEGIDPVLIGSHIVIGLQSLVSRNVDPIDSAVVSCSVFEGAKANNVIPDFARLGGNARTFVPQTRELVEKGIHRIARDIASAMGGTADVTYERGYPQTVNTVAESALAARVAADIVGGDGVILDAPPTTTSEDFGYMLQERPGCYVLIGNQDPQHTSVLHHPLYDFNDSILTIGTRYWIRLVEILLPVPVT